ncbi:hypothetical protein F5Y17DRAFT_274732 [Xylariaceae sp. FL0594]|nr:hypothetical protein F5Y17DRAFT_274732 [Xylariaceae sp. FL0594]
MKCRHCSDEGHMIRECPTAPPREFTGECRICKQEGHMAKDCPEKPAEVCNNCQEEGHVALNCQNPRKIDRGHIDEVEADVAWAKIEEAVKDRDMDDVKEAIQQYVKACPGLTYLDLEKGLRNCDIGLFLIAMEAPNMVSTLTLMDLQGNLGKKYKVYYRFESKPLRPAERPFWPNDDEENLARLPDAGEPVDSGLSKCSNCNGLGHIAKNCPEEKREVDRVTITCFNCGQLGHRTRDCESFSTKTSGFATDSG